MKDLLGREVQVGHYICYALTAGRSACLAVYQVKEVQGDKIKAVKLESSYGSYSWNVTTLDGKKNSSRARLIQEGLCYGQPRVCFPYTRSYCED